MLFLLLDSSFHPFGCTIKEFNEGGVPANKHPVFSLVTDNPPHVLTHTHTHTHNLSIHQSSIHQHEHTHLRNNHDDRELTFSLTNMPHHQFSEYEVVHCELVVVMCAVDVDHKATFKYWCLIGNQSTLSLTR